MNVCHVATIAAYPLKAGGFRGAYKALGQDRVASDVFTTLEEARHWAKTAAYDRHAGTPGYALAPMVRRGEYLANVWINA